MIVWLLLACGDPPPPPPDPCEVAWAEMSDLAGGMKSLGVEARLPEREPLIAACRALPEPARPCLQTAWLTDHRDECQALLGAASPAVTDALRAVLEPKARRH